MSFGQSSSGGSSSSGNPFGPQAYQHGLKLFRQIDPVLGQFMEQILAGLQTGGIGASIPIIQQSISESKAATSQALAGGRAEGARTGVANNPAFEGMLSALGMQGAQNTANIPSQYIESLFSMFPTLFGTGAGAATSLFNQQSSRSSNSSSGFNFSL